MWLFFLGVLLLGLFYLVGRYLVRVDPKVLAKSLQQFIGVLLCVIALILLASFRFAVFALPVGLLGLAFLKKEPLSFMRRIRRNTSQSGRKSGVKTGYLDMELNHVSGAMDGVVRSGSFRGRQLSALSEEELEMLYTEIIASADKDSLSLIETYLDGVVTNWREHFHSYDNSRHSSSTSSGPITEEQAYEILGLAPGADVSAIRAAHRRLMFKIHPDKGGSTALAAKINEAKDFLLRNHSSFS